MDKRLKTQLMGCENDLSKQIFLLHYKYATKLCVNADPLALIPLEVQLEGAVMNIEQVADVSEPRKDQFQIYLRKESDMPALITSIRSLHPEFLLDIVPDRIYEGQTEDENTLLYTMPPVNKERRDILLQAVDILYQKAKIQFERLKGEWTADISKVLKDEPELADEGQKRLDALFETKTDQLIGVKDDKIKEIEEAYERYVEEHPDEEGPKKQTHTPKQEQEDEDVKNSFTFDESWKEN